MLRYGPNQERRWSAVLAVRHLRDANDTEVLRLALTDAVDDVRLLAYSILDGPTTTRLCFEAGAHAFVSKQEPVEVLIRAVRLALEGGYRFPSFNAESADSPEPDAASSMRPPKRVFPSGSHPIKALGRPFDVG